ncbi:hypothetical protein V6N11_079955 [Hibiscus sabdariffa]|uniref:Uncharacterized protein n=1 Tax=Hibiscus sabdariffa TaxID=183260 RepID=A0ABR2RWY6_9ROSI
MYPERLHIQLWSQRPSSSKANINKENVGQMESSNHILVALRDVVLPIVSSLNNLKHVAVHVLKEGDDRVLKEKNGRLMVGLIRNIGSKAANRGLATVASLYKKSVKHKKRGNDEKDKTKSS